MKLPIIAILALGSASMASALSITTLYDRNNGGSNGGAVYFDITTAGNDIEIFGMDTNTNDTGITFGWSVYTRPGTYVGFTGSNAGWNLVATGTGTGAGINTPTPITLSNSFTLAASSITGMALVIGPEAGHDYSGTGTSPSPGQLQYSNSDLTLDLGSAGNVAFSGSAFTPRIWNGTLHYNVVPIPEPATMALLGLGAAAVLRRRRKA